MYRFEHDDQNHYDFIICLNMLIMITMTLYGFEADAQTPTHPTVINKDLAYLPPHGHAK